MADLAPFSLPRNVWFKTPVRERFISNDRTSLVFQCAGGGGVLFELRLLFRYGFTSVMSHLPLSRQAVVKTEFSSWKFCSSGSFYQEKYVLVSRNKYVI